MDIHIGNAVKEYFKENQTSLENVYFEAITNSIDANATRVDMTISIGNTKDIAKTFEIEIKDNGNGLNDQNFNRFCRLLDPKDKNHKGIGRLIYLDYFESVDVESHFKGKTRKFVFTPTFTKQSVQKPSKSPLVIDDGTTLRFKNYVKKKIHNFDYLKPDRIKQRLIHHLLPTLFEYKSQQKKLAINIQLNVPDGPNDKGLQTTSAFLTPDDIPNLTDHVFNIQFNDDLVADVENVADTEYKFTLKYLIDNNSTTNSTMLFSYIAIDNRTIDYAFFSSNYLPPGFNFILVLESDYFNGRADNSRINIKFASSRDEAIIKSRVSQELKEIVYTKFRAVQGRYDAAKQMLEAKFPHLVDFINFNSIELDVEKVLDNAQSKFFEQQKKLLLKDDNEQLDDNEYKQALDVSARLLMEYILYREITINRLEEINNKEHESKIHNLIVPKGKQFSINENNYYYNNTWLLDDKFMSFNHVFSEVQTEELIQKITNVEVEDKTRPDIAIVFSNDTTVDDAPYDVVIIELKPKTMDIYRRLNVKEELRARARALIDHCEKEIQRMWFYGIVEFDAKLERTLKDDGYKPLFSHGNSYYRELKMENSQGDDVIVQLNIMSYKGIIEDARARNKAFMDLLKQGISRHTDKV